jgi:hypothetical protein
MIRKKKLDFDWHHLLVDETDITYTHNRKYVLLN